jgi:hypothetical protein
MTSASPKFDFKVPVALGPEHISPRARVFATRHHLIEALVRREPAAIAEIGVALGDFSEFLLQTLRPALFVAFDIFDMHNWPMHWGRKSEEIFGELSHRQYFERRFAGAPTPIRIEEGMSRDTLLRYPPASFDLIYVDGGHGYEDVSSDMKLSTTLLKETGLLVANDYTMIDPYLPAAYGVVQAVNELLVAGGWEIVGFALEKNMFCDIALRRKI